MALLPKFPADTNVHHILSAAEGPTYAKHGIFIRTIISANSNCIGIFIITVPGCKIPFIIRIKIQRMEPCQSCRPSANMIDSVAQTINPGFRAIQLASIYSIRTGR